MISRHRWIVEEEGLSFHRAEDRARVYKFTSVRARCFSTYSSHWRQMKNAGYPLNVRGLEAWITEGGGNRIKTTSLQSWVDAVKCHQEASSGHTWSVAETRSIQRVVDGCCLAHPNLDSKPVGDITQEHVWDMLTRSSVPADVCDAFALMHATGCRGSEVCNMKHKMFSPVLDEKGTDVVCYQYCQKRSKAKRRTLGKDENIMEVHYTDPLWNDLITTLIDKAATTFEQQKSPTPSMIALGMPMVPGFKGPAENVWIKVAAEELGWEPTLTWRVHSLRYGAAVDAAMQAAKEGGTWEDIMSAVKKRTAHLSTNMAEKYAEFRDIKVARGRALERLREHAERKNGQGVTREVKLEEFIRFGKKSVVTK